MGCMRGERCHSCEGSAHWWALATTSNPAWAQVPTPEKTGRALLLPPLFLLSPGEGKHSQWRDAQRHLLPLHAKSRNDLSIKHPRQVLSQAHVLKGLCNFLKVYLAFLTSRKGKKSYLSLDLIVCQQQPSLSSIISSTYTQYWIRLFSYRKVNACKISLRIRPSPWQTEAFLQEAAAAAA